MACAEQRPIDSIDTQKPSRRRWLRIGIVALIAVVLAIALVRYRLSLSNDAELNDVEKQFVGEWTYGDYTGRPITYHIRFNPDRSYKLWSVEGYNQQGNWHASADKSTLSLSEEMILPIAYRQSIEYTLDRILRPQLFNPPSDDLAVEALSESTIRVRVPDGNKIVYHRAVPASD